MIALNELANFSIKNIYIMVVFLERHLSQLKGHQEFLSEMLTKHKKVSHLNQI
jgi:hypothetical protein